MAENETKKPSVRKLTVDNFSVIKHAELDFGKITVLIGPQASGKSLLCKLAYFLGQVVPEAVNGLALLRLSEQNLLEVIAQEFQERFPSQGWGNQPGKIDFVSELFTISLSLSPSDAVCVPRVNREFLETYRTWVEFHGVEGSAKEVTERLRTGLVGAVGPFRFDESVYIPTGRAFFSTPNRGFASMSGKNLDWITQRFSNEIDWEYRGMLEPSGPSSDLYPQFVESASGILGGRVVREKNILLFSSMEDGLKLPFQWLSSGTQELLPLLNPLANLVYNFSSNPMNVWEPFSSKIGPIFVEEPELSVFPSTQYELMKLFAWLSGEDRLEFPFVITTHSPYILSAFNNLIEAEQAVRNNPQLRGDVAAIVPERYWIKSGDFNAYAIEDGKLKSILNESGFVEGNYLDQVSETIGDEFDRLIKLEYNHAKAS
jgi:hypothetical protein